MYLVTDSRSQSEVLVKDFNPDGSCTRTLPVSGYPLGTYKTFNGSREGRFVKGQIRLNPVTIATNGCSCDLDYIINERHPVWGQRSFDGPLLATIFRNLDYLIPGDHVVDESHVDRALQTAYAGVRNPDFDGQLFLAELGETVAMLRSPLKSLLKSMREVRNAKVLKKRLSAFGDLSAGAWLQYTYGVRPLIKDITTLYTMATEHKIDAPLLRSGGRSKSGDLYISPLTQTYNLAGLTGEALLSGYRRRTTTARVYYRVKWNNVVWDIMERWGFNPLSLPVTLWQTVPCSFVADWFAMIGPWLESLKPHPDLDMLGNCISEKYECMYTAEWLTARLAVLTPPARTYTFHPTGKLRRWDERLIRVVNRPIPTAPCWGQGLTNLSKSISLASLTWQRLPKITR